MKRRIFVCASAFAVATAFLLFKQSESSSFDDEVQPVIVAEDNEDPAGAKPTMVDVLQMAADARKHISTTLDDYTATFVKQEADDNGKLGEETIIEMKVQTKLRNDTDDAPIRVYLKFSSPESLKGREVIWGEDLYDGKMAVHETGLLLGWKTLWLDPTGMIAMQGQRYPISEIGLKRLVEKLVERGEKDRDNPDVSVAILREQEINGVTADLIQVRRATPNPDDKDDFSLAEIYIDPVRQLVLCYRSFGWRDESASNDSLPLLESYSYTNIKTNTGLKDSDFDVKNPEYNFP